MNKYVRRKELRFSRKPAHLVNGVVTSEALSQSCIYTLLVLSCDDESPSSHDSLSPSMVFAVDAGVCTMPLNSLCFKAARILENIRQALESSWVSGVFGPLEPRVFANAPETSADGS